MFASGSNARARPATVDRALVRRRFEREAEAASALDPLAGFLDGNDASQLIEPVLDDHHVPRGFDVRLLDREEPAAIRRD